MTRRPQPRAETHTSSPAEPVADSELLTLTEAAIIARRSVKTLERAYSSGRLDAYKDGNGRGISIEYGDLRAWLKQTKVDPRNTEASKAQVSACSAPSPIRPQISKLEENLRLLDQATRRRR